MIIIISVAIAPAIAIIHGAQPTIEAHTYRWISIRYRWCGVSPDHNVLIYAINLYTTVVHMNAGKLVFAVKQQ